LEKAGRGRLVGFRLWCYQFQYRRRESRLRRVKLRKKFTLIRA
jgi:hypothetical protein